jgi:hypothetical protein
VDGSRTGDARSDGLDPGMTILNHIGFTNDRYRRASQASFLNSFRRFPGTRAQVSGPDGRTTLSGVAFWRVFSVPTTTGGDGIGSGTFVFRESSGHSCSGAGFSVSLFPPQNP